MKIGQFKRDTAKVEGGDWVTDLPGLEGVSFKVRGLNSTHFADTQSRLMRSIPAHKRGDDGSIPATLAYGVLGEAMALSLLLDWKGIEGDDGKPLAYDAALAKVWLTDVDFVHFHEAVMEAARRVDLRARNDAAQVEKN